MTLEGYKREQNISGAPLSRIHFGHRGGGVERASPQRPLQQLRREERCEKGSALLKYQIAHKE